MPLRVGCYRDSVLKEHPDYERTRFHLLNSVEGSLVLSQAPAYLPIKSSSFFLVAGGIAARSVMMACFKADPHLQARSGRRATPCRSTSHALDAFFTRFAMISSTVTASCSSCQQS